ncbi:MAG TPA: hypothetical protein VIZ17_05740 [Acetobacteraceae bacterium]
MNRMFAIGLLLTMTGSGSVLAQTTSPAASTPPAAASTSNATSTQGAPVAGANSFTMGQAQKRLENNGFTQVSPLTKDSESIWRGQAMKDGKTVDVAVDYQGNIVTN